MAYPSPNPEPGWNRDWNHTLESRAAAAVAGIELRYAATAAAPSPSPTPPPLESHWNHQCRAELRMSPGPARPHVDHHGPGDARLSHIVLSVYTASKATM